MRVYKVIGKGKQHIDVLERMDKVASTGCHVPMQILNNMIVFRCIDQARASRLPGA